MKKYHIGLDFGTNQTKVCTYSVQDDFHEFFMFSNGSFFIPSRVALLRNNKLEYGDSTSGMAIQEYYYFKIAAAEDKEFYIETYDTVYNGDVNFYYYNKFKSITPEFLSIAYLTYIILTVKEYYINKNKSRSNKGGLFGRLSSDNLEPSEECHFTIRLGLPTEWHSEKSKFRKWKFENILLLSHHLQRKYLNASHFIDASISDIIEELKLCQASIKHDMPDQFRSRLQQHGLSVYPEAAAGLTFMLKKNQLKSGYYATMDIGAGTTDISFFKVLESGSIVYRASESYLVALNDVYREFSNASNSIEELKQAEQKFMDAHAKDQPNKIELRYKASIRSVHNKLESRLKKLYARRVHAEGVLRNFKDQPIIVYGGGSFIPHFINGAFLVFDHGASLNFPIHVHMEKFSITKYTSIINILPSEESWRPVFPLMVVSLGLSYINPDNTDGWFDESEYMPIDNGAILVPHDSWEDRYVYH